MSHHRTKVGFTLMEMLVALTIIVAILAMVYGSVAATTRSIDASGARMARVERACFALRLMTRQIRCAYAPSVSPSARGSNETRRQSGLGSMTDTERTLAHKRAALFQADSRNPRGEILSFVTSSGLGAGPDAPRGLFRVTYLYDRPSATLFIRRQDEVDSSDNRARPKRPDSLLTDVAGVELTFYDGRQWLPAWDAAARHELPRAVKVEIAVTDEAGRSRVLGTTVPIVQHTSPESRNTKRAVAAGQP